MLPGSVYAEHRHGMFAIRMLGHDRSDNRSRKASHTRDNSAGGVSLHTHTPGSVLLTRGGQRATSRATLRLRLAGRSCTLRLT